jgi:hypothetical protein
MSISKAALLLSMYFCASASAQFVAFNKDSNGSNPITIPEGEKWKILSYSLNYNTEVFTNTNKATRIGIIPSTGEHIWGGEGMGGSASGITIVGPAVIWTYPSLVYYFAFQKTTTSSSTAPISSTSVVIPTTSSGDVDVKMEQSADNVTWTECLPGTYNSSTVKRFFRLRAVEK